MVIDIIFLLFICVILIAKLIRSFSMKASIKTFTHQSDKSNRFRKYNFYQNSNAKNTKKIQNVLVEDIVETDGSAELENYDKDLIKNQTTSTIEKIRKAFFTGDISKIKNSVTEDILINMESKIRIYSTRPELVKIESMKIKKLYKQENKILADVYVMCELKDNSRKYINVENWTLHQKLNQDAKKDIDNEMKNDMNNEVNDYTEKDLNRNMNKKSNSNKTQDSHQTPSQHQGKNNWIVEYTSAF